MSDKLDTGSAMIALRRPDAFTFEARRYCEEYDLGPESLAKVEAYLRHRAFMEAIQPILKAIARAEIMALASPRLMAIMHEDGRIESASDTPNLAARATIAEADRLIASIALQHGITPCPIS